MADAIDKKAKELVAHLCRHRDSYKPDLSREEKEDIAGSIAAVCIMADEEANSGKSVNSRYGLFNDMEDISLDLECSNGDEEDWKKLIRYINELEKQVNNSESNHQS